MDTQYLTAIVRHLLPEYGFTRVETQGADDKLRRRKLASVEEVVSEALTRQTTATGGVYFSPHGFNTADFESRAGDVGASRCLYHDIDINPAGAIEHEGREPIPCYATKSEAYAAACAVLDHASLPRPTAVIDSGRGLHLYWRLSADIHPSDFIRLGVRMKELWRTRDTRLAADLSRGSSPGELMRLPGSVNHKSGTYVWAYEGTVLGDEIDRQVFEDGLPLAADTVRLPSTDAQPQSSLGLSGGEVLTPIEDVYAGCRLFRLMWSYPERFSGYMAWQNSMMIFQSTPDINDGLAAFHTYCSRMPNYDPAEVNEDFAKANFRGNPVSCSTLRASTGVGDAACKGCPVYEKYPNGGTCMRAKQVADLAANTAAANARAEAEPVPVQALTAPNVQLAPPASAFEGGGRTDQMWAYVPGQQLPRALFDPNTAVAGFFYDQSLNLVHVSLEEVEREMPPDPMTGEVKTAKSREAVASVIYNGMYVWIESKVMAGRQSDHSFANVRCARGTVSNPMFATIEIPLTAFNDMRAVVSKLLTAGVAVNIGMERALQSHLNAQLKAAPEITAATRFGWVDDIPTADSSFVVAGTMVRGDASMVEVAHVGRSSPQMNKFCLRGSLDEQIEVVSAYSAKGVPAAKALIAAAVAAPLYHVLDQGSFMVSITGESGSGKSKLLAVLQAIWGYNDGNIMTGNDTLNSIMNQLNMCNGVGAFMDEITNMSNEDFTALAMSVTAGRERHRLTANAQLREADGKWNLPVFCTSNRPLIDKVIGFDAGGDAARARVMDLTLSVNGQPVKRVLQDTTHAEAAELDAKAARNTGFLGLAAVQYTIQNFDTLAKYITDLHVSLDAKSEATQRFSAAMGACAIAGDYILKGLLGPKWQTGDGEMASIVDRMLAQSQARRTRHKLDPLQVLMAHLADRGDRVVRTRPARGRASKAGHLQVVGGSAAKSSLRVDIADEQIEARVDVGISRRQARAVSIAVTESSLLRMCNHYGMDTGTFLYSVVSSTVFKAPTQVPKPEFINLLDGIGGQGATTVNSFCYKFELELSNAQADALLSGIDDPAPQQQPAQGSTP